MNRRKAVIAAFGSAIVGFGPGTSMAASIDAIKATSLLAKQTNSDITPPDFESLPWREVMYVGMLSTWYDVFRNGLTTFFGGMEKLSETPTSIRSRAEVVEAIGVWPHLYSDVNAITPPSIYSDAHAHFLDALNELDKAARSLSVGVIEGDADALRGSLDSLDSADAFLRQFVASLPFAVPDRSEIGF